MTLAQGVLLAVGGIALLALVPRPSAALGKARGRARAPRRPLWRRGARVARSAPDLAAVDRLLNLSVSSAEDAHVRLRPLVAGLARQRLADHTGVRLDGDPDVAAAAVGPDVWELVRPDGGIAAQSGGITLTAHPFAGFELPGAAVIGF